MAVPELKEAGAKPALLLVVLCVGALVGTSLYQRGERQDQASARKGASWYDLDRTAPETAPSASSKYAIATPRSSLDMIQAEPGFAKNKPAAPPPKEAAAKTTPPAEAAFAGHCRDSEARIEALARDYTARYPIIAQYGREWMSHPDLKKLNDDYVRDHDPVKFIRGLAGSKNFVAMFQKYAVQPAIQAFALDALKQTPPAAAGAALEFASKDKDGKTFMQQFAQTLGLPPALLDPNAGQPMDQKAVMDWVARNNPDVAKAMSQIPPGQLPAQAGKN